MTTLSNNASHPIANLVLAHGAGAGKDSDFMQWMAQHLAKRQINVVRFDFPYMQKALALGKRHPPNKMPVLIDSFQTVLSGISCELPLFIGGKSMGGRVASMILEDSTAIAGICLGYPFHPPGKPDKLRTEHLMTLGKPLLVLQGERDTFGNQNEIPSYNLPSSIQCDFLPDGDHSFKPRKASGFTQEQHVETAAERICQFIQEQV